LLSGARNSLGTENSLLGSENIAKEVDEWLFWVNQSVTSDR
jgi:hypothetical protein